MTKETYCKWMEYLKSHPKKAKALHISNKLMTGTVFAAYPILLLWLLYERSLLLSRAIIVPLDAFVVLSAFRFFVNAQRPYEKFQVAPIIPKTTKGDSFPSRHVFSTFMIAMTFLAVCPITEIGIVFLVIGVFMAINRVLCGVHFPRDVIAGAICGILAGVVGFWLL